MISTRSSLNRRRDRGSDAGGLRRLRNGPSLHLVRSGSTARAGCPRVITCKIPSPSISGIRKIPLLKSWRRTLSNRTRNDSARWLTAPRFGVGVLSSASELYSIRSRAARPNSSHAILSVSRTRVKSVISKRRVRCAHADYSLSSPIAALSSSHGSTRPVVWIQTEPY